MDVVAVTNIEQGSYTKEDCVDSISIHHAFEQKKKNSHSKIEETKNIDEICKKPNQMNYKCMFQSKMQSNQKNGKKLVYIQIASFFISEYAVWFGLVSA